MTFTDMPFITLNTIKPSCLFVEAKMGGVLMSFLVDTGSAVTILDDNVFDMLSGIIKPKQLKSVNKTLLCAKGESIPILGMSNCVIPILFLNKK